MQNASIEKEIVALIKNKPFYAHFIQTMRRIYTDEIGTAGVNITDKINLYISPKFFATLKPVEKVAILEHEVLHIINKHCVRGRKAHPLIFGLACDIAINQYIKESTDKQGRLYSRLPDHAQYPEKYKLPPEKTAEKYYKLLMKGAKKSQGQQGQGQARGKKGKSGKEGEMPGQEQGGKGDRDTLDNHSVWEKGTKNEDLQHQIIKNSIKKTLEKTKDYGHLPAHILEEIKKALHHETINWRSELQRFLYRATIVNTVPTRKKPNRRFGIYFDGSKVECKLDMLVAIDTSGSISNSDLSLFFSEIDKIKALGMQILVVECDAQVHKTYKYKNMPKVVSGRGGTAFEPVFKFANSLKQKPNCIVYLTDLYGNTGFKNESRIPTLWAITIDGDNVNNIPFGRGIKLKNDMGEEF